MKINVGEKIRKIRYMSNRVGVLYKGDFVEMGDVDEIFYKLKHNYTKKLLSSILTMK